MTQGSESVVVPRVPTEAMREAATEIVVDDGNGGRTALNWEEAAKVWSAMIAAAPSTSVREEELRSMGTAPTDGLYILARFQPPEGSHADYLSGRVFVIRHEGVFNGYDLGWSGFPGYGGVRSSSFAGWLPLPAALVPSTDEEADHADPS